MRIRPGIRVQAAAVVLTVVSLAHADCVRSMGSVSAISVFPNRMAHAVATNASIIGVAKLDSDPSTNAIYFATYGTDLAQISPDVAVAAVSLHGTTALLWNGSEFGLFYQSPSLTLMLQRIDASGNLMGAPIAIASHGWSPGDELDVTWDPARGAYAIERTVTVGPDFGVWVSLISRTGAVELDSLVPAILSPPALPHVAALADGTVGMTILRSGAITSLTAAFLDPANAIRMVTVSDAGVNDLRVATDGESLLIIKQLSTSTGGTTLHVAQVAPNGVITSDAPFLSGSGVGIVPSSITWNPALSEWALTYIDAPLGIVQFAGDTRFRRFKSVTGMASDTLLSPDPTHSRLTAPFPPIFVNGAYIAAIGRVLTPAEGTESYLVSLCPFFVTATANYPLQTPYAPITFTATPSGGTPGYTYSWNFGDLSSAAGAVVTHAYNVPGTYTITLNAVDATGAESAYKFSVTVAFLRHRAVR